MIDRKLLRSEVRKEILKRVLNGKLEPGQRINESRLSAELGVSRTPLREALTALEQDSVLDSDAGRGFFVKALTVEEITEILPIAATMEALAMRTAGIPSDAVLDRLEKINIEMEAKPDDGEALSALDEKWHAALLKGCPNNRLMQMLISFRNQIRRYDYAYMGTPGQGAASVAQHREIIALLREGNLEAAATALEKNLTDAIEPMANWLKQLV